MSSVGRSCHGPLAAAATATATGCNWQARIANPQGTEVATKRAAKDGERPGGKAPPTTATANANTNPNCTEAVHQRLSPASARPHQPTDRAPSTPSALHRSVEVRSVSDTTTLTTHPFSQNAHSGRTSALLLYLCSCASQCADMS
ncbi:hypothetical protein J3E71DRAFT_345269 [Bipolaris maydis]|nr:hypothetical protein J3E71DRAFT_345269 [Bipolaris maydis]